MAVQGMPRISVSIGRLGLVAVGCLTVVFLIVPTLIIIPMSANPTRILQFPPSGFSLTWYARVFTDREWSQSLVHSIEVATLVALLASILGTAAAYALVRGNPPGRRFLMGLFVSPLVVPVVIVAIGMFSVYVGWGLTGTLPGLVLAHTCLSVPFVVVTVATSLRTIDRNLESAARGLGASPWQAFRAITLPLASPGIVAGALFAFTTSWDEVIAAIFLTNAQFKTLPVQMWSQMNEVLDPSIAAVSTMLFVVTTIAASAAIVVRRGRLL